MLWMTSTSPLVGGLLGSLQGSLGVPRFVEGVSARSPARLRTLRWNGVAVNSWARGESIVSLVGTWGDSKASRFNFSPANGD